MTNARRARALRAAKQANSRSVATKSRTGRPVSGSKQRSRRPGRSSLSKLAIGLAGLAAMGILIGVLLPAGSSKPFVSGPPGPEGVPLEIGRPIAPASTAVNGQMVDGIGCDSSEQLVYHVHTHLCIYVNGVLRPLPAGIGIVSPVAENTPFGPFYEATQCYYWLHVHAADGIIHIESPSLRVYTLGEFFDIWRQPLGPRRVGSETGPLTVWVNGRRFWGNPRAIELGSHEDVQIDVGRPVVPPSRVNWSVTGL